MGEQYTVLICDDDASTRHVLRMRLETQGYQTVEASDGQEALRCVQAQKPDVIIMDVVMTPINGYQACRTLKSSPATKDIPVILLTSKDAESERFWGLETGADAYITKPYDAQHLLSQVETFLKNKAIPPA